MLNIVCIDHYQDPPRVILKMVLAASSGVTGSLFYIIGESNRGLKIVLTKTND